VCVCVCVCVCVRVRARVCRYKDCLKEGIKKGGFDAQEMELLVKLVKIHGVGESHAKGTYENTGVCTHTHTHTHVHLGHATH